MHVIPEVGGAIADRHSQSRSTALAARKAAQLICAAPPSIAIRYMKRHHASRALGIPRGNGNRADMRWSWSTGRAGDRCSSISKNGLRLGRAETARRRAL